MNYDTQSAGIKLGWQRKARNYNRIGGFKRGVDRYYSKYILHDNIGNHVGCNVLCLFKRNHTTFNISN